jgi:hypothetical protein
MYPPDTIGFNSFIFQKLQLSILRIDDCGNTVITPPIVAFELISSNEQFWKTKL